tara:strand:+ start:52 stop:978 length:927 start_codon:yes stop_codon:yes gene_type:complete
MASEISNTTNEGEQFGVLYHYTEFLGNILNNNMLEGPVSLTRSRDSNVKDWLGNIPILVLDKDKLRQNYKIIPTKDIGPDDANIQYDEMEEVIDKDITNLSKYIVKVILPNPDEEYENALKEKDIPYEIKGLEEELYDPNDHVLDYMKSSEWKAGMPDGPKDDDTSPVIKYNRGGMYSAATGQGGAGTMYEGDEVDEMMGGTMNNQEKAKHSKNLKKLKVAMRKQGDQMVPVPDYIKGTLTRKLYEKVTKDSVICDNCSWDWEIKDGGDDLYICHKCDHDNTPKIYECDFEVLTKDWWKDQINKNLID